MTQQPIPPFTDQEVQALGGELSISDAQAEWAAEKAEPETPLEEFSYVHGRLILRCAGAAAVTGLTPSNGDQWVNVRALFGKRITVSMGIEVSTHSTRDAIRSFRAKLERFLAELENQ